MTTNDDARVETIEQARDKTRLPILMYVIEERDRLYCELEECRRDIAVAAHDAGVSYEDFVRVMRYLDGQPSPR
jgi:hypothetical protein